jgi:uroporphyrinogen-III synthase
MPDRLNGNRILILETREEAQFSKLLSEQGADVLQCPMFTIEDVPDPAAVDAWIRGAIAQPLDDLVLMTGEGLRRLMKAARRIALDQDFIVALKTTRTWIRGPKPGRALREIGLEPQMTTEKPTTDGMIAILSRVDLTGKRVGVQLYPDKDHTALLGAVTAKGATAIPVTPYIYDTRAADDHIVTAIDEMVAGRIDAIALTNLGQIRRMFDVARAKGLETRLREGFAKTSIASVGPAVSDELKAHGLAADIYPANDAFFMKPLISAMAMELARKRAKLND